MHPWYTNPSILVSGGEVVYAGTALILLFSGVSIWPSLLGGLVGAVLAMALVLWKSRRYYTENTVEPTQGPMV